MTTGQNQNSVRPRPATKNLVLPQVQYHPSIQNSVDSSSAQNQKPRKPTKTQTEENTHAKRSPASSGSGLDSAKTVALKGTQQGSKTVMTDVFDGPSSFLVPANQVPGPKGADLGAEGTKKNLVLPQVWYHPSIKNSGNSSKPHKMSTAQTGKVLENVQATRAGDSDALCPEDLGASAKGGALNGTRHDSKAAKSSGFKVLPQVQYHQSIKDYQGSPRNGPPEKTLEMETPQCTDVTRKQDLERSKASGLGPEDGDERGDGCAHAPGGTSQNGLTPDETRQNARRRRRRRGGGQNVQGSDSSEGKVPLKDEATVEGLNSGAALCNGGDFNVVSDGKPQKASRRKATKTKPTVGDDNGKELHGTNCEILPKDGTPSGTRLEDLNLRPSEVGAEGPPQEATRRKARKMRPGIGDGLKPLTPPPASVSAEGPEGLAALPGLDLLVDLRPGSSLDQSVVEKVEALTRGQRTNPDWFKYRKNRITASVAHTIAHCGFVNGKSSAPPASYVRNITGEGPRVQTRAMTWGIDHEKEAVQKYQEQKSAALGHPVSVLDCGLFIDRSRPWLAASPDGIVTDSRTGRWLRCLEVKCPFKHRDRSVERACGEDKDFCLEITDQQGAQQTPDFALKRSHPYFTQVQCQLAVTGLKEADFVVFTVRDLAVVPVRFDPEFWDQTVTKLERFYSEAVVPVLRERNPQWDREL